MVQLTDQGRQVLEMYRKLPVSQRLGVLLEAARDSQFDAAAAHAQSEPRLRELARQQGLDWDGMAGDQRESFIADLIEQDD